MNTSAVRCVGSYSLAGHQPLQLSPEPLNFDGNVGEIWVENRISQHFDGTLSDSSLSTGLSPLNIPGKLHLQVDGSRVKVDGKHILSWFIVFSYFHYFETFSIYI